MRSNIPGRKFFTDYSSDIQRIINDRPSNASVTRKTSRSTARGNATWSPITTFECRVDSYRPRIGGTEELSEVGETVQHTYLLLARFGQDQFGNNIDIMHGDNVVIDTIGTPVFRVVNVVNFSDQSKTEAILVISE